MERGEGTTRPRPTAAGRLLTVIVDAGKVDDAWLAHRLGVRARQLEECRLGVRPLDHEVQMRLAALALLVAPAHERLAHALYAQAQAALRAEAGADQRHTSYPKAHLR